MAHIKRCKNRAAFRGPQEITPTPGSIEAAIQTAIDGLAPEATQEEREAAVRAAIQASSEGVLTDETQETQDPAAGQEGPVSENPENPAAPEAVTG